MDWSSTYLVDVVRYPGGAELTGYLPSWRGSRVREQANNLTLDTTVPT
jgi:hypothetical protein